MNTNRILFVGGGNITRAIVSGLISNHYPAHELTVIDRHAEKCNFFSEKYNVAAKNKLPAELIHDNVIILAVKPQAAKEACLQLQPLLHHQKPLILSVMTGITISTLRAWLGANISIVRAMPNTPVLVKAGATGLFANTLVSEKEKKLAEFLMSSVGIIAWLEQENQIDTITAFSGSGPAYFFYLMEAMQKTAIQLGLPEKISAQFAIQTALGAALLAQNSDESLSILRDKVTSKGGTTEAALDIFLQKDFFSMIKNAMQAAKNKAEELSEKYK